MKRRFNVNYHVIASDDPNYEVLGHSISIHNQGSTVVRVNEDILIPDDRIEIEVPQGDDFLKMRLLIKFLALYPFERTLSAYPQIWDGDRLVIKELRQDVDYRWQNEKIP